MSVPARKATAPSRKQAAPKRSPAPKRSTAPKPQPARAPTSAASSAGRRLPIGFLALSLVVIGGLVVGLVTLNALLAQRSFRIQDMESRVTELSEQYQVLTRRTAQLSAPGRIAAWAEEHGMRLPDADDLHVLHVPSSPGRAAIRLGEETPLLDPDRLGLKAVVEGSG